MISDWLCSKFSSNPNANLQLMATSSPQLPLAQAWFKATALSSVPLQQSQLHHDPFDSGGKSAVAATDFSCQVGLLSLALLLLHGRYNSNCGTEN